MKIIITNKLCYRRPNCRLFCSLSALAREAAIISGLSRSAVLIRYKNNPDIEWEDLIKPAKSTGGPDNQRKTKLKQRQDFQEIISALDERKQAMGLTP